MRALIYFAVSLRGKNITKSFVGLLYLLDWQYQWFSTLCFACTYMLCVSLIQFRNWNNNYITYFLQHVDEENSYLCGYLKIKGLTEEFPTLTTFFDGEIISAKYPFLTRKWDADEDVDRKHWV